MSPRPTRRGWCRRLATTAAALTALAPLGGLVRPDAADAAPVTATDAALTWRLTNHAWANESLAYTDGPPPEHDPASEAVAPAVRGDDGFEFTADEATFDPATGAAEASFEGSVALGNTNRGGYRVRFGSPTVIVDADGSGEITADLAYCTGTADCRDNGYTDAGRVVVATFSTSERAVDGATVAITATPDFPVQPDDPDVPPAIESGRELSHELTAALPASLRGHFRETAAGQDAKAPSPFTLSFTHAAGPEPAPLVQVSPRTDLDPEADSTTLTITGTGFTKAADDPSPFGLGVYVRWCVATEGRPGADQCLAAPQHWVGPTVPPSTAALGADGSFSVTLDVPRTFTAGGTTHDCAEVACGIHVRRDHNGGGDLTYDSFTPVTFADPSEPTTPTQPTVPTQPTTPPAPAPGVGTLDWGVKRSFRNYVLEGPAQGTVTAGPPATPNADGTFRFPAGTPVTYDGPDDVVAQFEGSVRFTGHHGALDLTLADPRVEIDGDVGVLLVDGSSRDLDTGVVTVLDDVAVATLDVGAIEPTALGDVVTFADVPATLTAEGEFAFEGFYAAGDPLDPVTFAIEVDDPGDLAPPTEPVAGCVPEVVVTGQPVTVCGEGFLAGEQVQVFLHSDPVFLDVTTADADGAVSATVVVPADTPPGLHRIELRGVTSGKQLFTPTFTVQAAAQPGPRDLPRTGGEARPPAAVGVLLALGGVALVARSRRVLARA